MKKFFVIIGAIVSFLFLVYLIWPDDANDVYTFKALPNSVKSTLPGDSVQVTNLTAFFSDNYRDFVIPYYQEDYKNLVRFPFPPLELNYPPEYAFTVIKDQTQSTYLEELTYPFRGSLYINGLEPFIENTREPRYDGATLFGQSGGLYQTKVILRYYPSSLVFRIIVWLGINSSIIFLYKVGKRIFYA